MKLESIHRLLYLDALSIPEAMATPYKEIQIIAWALFGLLFVFALIRQTAFTATSKQGANFGKTIKTALFISIGLALYQHIFLKIVALADAIGMSLCEVSKIHKLISFISKESYTYVEVAAGGGRLGKAIGTINALANLVNPKILILGFLSVAVSIAEVAFLAVRYALLSVLYVFGPLAFVGYVFEPTKIILKGWFVGMLQVSFWIVFLRILESVMVAFNIESLVHSGQLGDIISWTIVCTVFLGLIILTPMITGKILSGQNLGEVGSLAVAAATVIPAKYAAATHIAATFAKQTPGAFKSVGKGVGSKIISTGTNAGKKIKSGYKNIQNKLKPRR